MISSVCQTVCTNTAPGDIKVGEQRNFHIGRSIPHARMANLSRKVIDCRQETTRTALYKHLRVGFSFLFCQFWI